MTDHYLATNDEASKRAVLAIVQNNWFARETTALSQTASLKLSREVAYAIMAHLDAIRLGKKASPRLRQLVSQALSHLDQYMGAETPFNEQGVKIEPYLKPFFIALTSEALTRYIDETNPANSDQVKQKLALVAKALYEKCWDQKSGTMLYVDHTVPGEEASAPAPDLNPLIAPFYGWLHAKKIPLPAGFNTPWIEIGDKLFVAGVPVYTADGYHQSGPYLNGDKQFNQFARYGTKYLDLTGRNI